MNFYYKFLLFYLLLVLNIFNLFSMENPPAQSLNKQLPLELTTAVVLTTITTAHDIQEAAKRTHALRQVNKEILDIIENEHNSTYIVKTLHKKFDLPKLQVRYLLNTRQTRKILLERIETVAKYALLNITTLLKPSIKNFHRNISKTVTQVVLDRAFQTVRQLRKNKNDFWRTTQNINEEYNKLVSHDTIDISLPTHSNEKLISMTKYIAGLLLYLTQYASTIMNDITLSKALREYTRSYTSFRTLAELLATHVENIFYPNKLQSAIAQEVLSRINVLSKDNS